MIMNIKQRKIQIEPKTKLNYNIHKEKMYKPRDSCWAIHLAAAIAISLFLMEYSILLAFSLL